MVALAMPATEMNVQAAEKELLTLSTSVQPLRPEITESQVFAELATHNEQRKSALHDYSVLRTYQVIDPKGKVHAEEVGRMDFLAPDKKTFTVDSEAGSSLVRRMALNPLIKSEIEAAAGKEHHDSAISADNYSLKLLGEQQVGPSRCFVAEALPKRKDKYLFEGKLWIDVEDYAVVRIEGHPAKQLSFWIQHADFVRQYQKIDGFWLPQKDQTLVQVRLYGKKILTIEHRNYIVNSGQSKDARPIAPEAAVTVTSSR
jgi:outer membrane lipoprotein-sorting protein